MDYLVRRYEISERRACKLARQHRSTQRYAAMHGVDPGLVVVATGYPDQWTDTVDPGGAPGDQRVDEQHVDGRPTFDALMPAEGLDERDDAGEEGRRVADRVLGADGLCDAVIDTVQAVGRIPITVVGGFVRFTSDSGSACVHGARATAGLLGRLVPSGRCRPRGRLRT